MDDWRDFRLHSSNVGEAIGPFLLLLLETVTFVLGLLIRNTNWGKMRNNSAQSVFKGIRNISLNNFFVQLFTLLIHL